MSKRKRKIVWYACQSADDTCNYGDDKGSCPFAVPFEMVKDLNFSHNPTFGRCMHKDMVVFFKRVKKPKVRDND